MEFVQRQLTLKKFGVTLQKTEKLIKFIGKCILYGRDNCTNFYISIDDEADLEYFKYTIPTMNVN